MSSVQDQTAAASVVLGTTCWPRIVGASTRPWTDITHLKPPRSSGDYALCTPLPRVGEVEDVANLAMFLLSDAATWITGQCVNVDGGHILRRGPDYSSMMVQMYGEEALRGVVTP